MLESRKRIVRGLYVGGREGGREREREREIGEKIRTRREYGT